jgi:serine/threonine protein phosphatase 1
MATVVVGDIHGNLAALSGLLDMVRPEVGTGDEVVFVGDYIDRGSESRGCVDAILALRATSAAGVVCLLGNHEEWLLETRADHSRHSWLLGMEGLATIQSYSDAAAAEIRSALAEAGLRLFIGRYELPYRRFFDAMPEPHHAFFSGLALSHENADCVCSHAGLNPAIPGVRGQVAKSLIWGHPAFPSEYAGEIPAVYGHWNNAVAGAEGWPVPVITGPTICVDTSRFGVVTAVRMPDWTLFQSDGERTRAIALRRPND